MIPLKKTTEPPVLSEHGEQWTREYIDAATPAMRRLKEKWRHGEIKRALAEETGAKCAYCEGLTDDVSYPHVEHIQPKSVFPELAHVWTNLTSSCERCNINKGDYYTPERPLLNPYTDDVASHLRPVGAIVDWPSGNEQAEITVRKLQLNRADLVLARARRLEKIRDLLERWNTTTGALRQVLEGTIRLDAAEGEFSSSVLALLESHDFPTQGTA